MDGTKKKRKIGSKRKKNSKSESQSNLLEKSVKSNKLIKHRSRQKPIEQIEQEALPQKTISQVPIVVPRPAHTLSRAQISKNALKVLYRLKDAGFEAYLVGGGVRDLLLGFNPKDFDLATDAKPWQIKELFRNCRLIGKRFRLAHICFGEEIIDLATFRGQTENDSRKTDETTGMLLRDNVWGTLDEDAWRRDFTINCLYYNIKDFSIVDYTNGMEDLKTSIVRMIGDPLQRYHEDPVRMLRAVRLAAKIGFEIEKNTAEPILNLSGLLKNIPSSRLYDEINKWFTGGKSLTTFYLLRNYKLFNVLFPQTELSLQGENAVIAEEMCVRGFANTDKRLAENKKINPAFLFAVLLWWPLQIEIDKLIQEGMNQFDAFSQASRDVLKKQNDHVLIPARLSLIIKEIWTLQHRLERCTRSKVNKLLANIRFRAAYDFLLIRAHAGEEVGVMAEWWTKYQEVNEKERVKMLKVL